MLSYHSVRVSYAAGSMRHRDYNQVNTYTRRLPVLRDAGVAAKAGYMEAKPNGGRRHERYFNETVIRGRCSFRTSDEKMEP